MTDSSDEFLFRVLGTFWQSFQASFEQVQAKDKLQYELGVDMEIKSRMSSGILVLV